MKNKIKLLIFLLQFNAFNIYSANPGDLDVTYNSGGSQPGTNVQPVLGNSPTITSVGITDNAIQADQKCVICGIAGDGSDQFISLSRFNNDGTLDTATFNSSDPDHPGVVITQLSQSSANAIAIQADQKIVIAGVTSTQPTIPTGFNNFIVGRYDSNGDLDSTFGTDPFGGFAGIVLADFQTDATATSVAIQADQKIIAGGNSDDQSLLLLAKFNTDGFLDTTFGSGTGLVQTLINDLNPDIGQITMRDLKLTSDEKILVCGHTDDVTIPVYVARYNNDGSLDTTFNSGGVTPGFVFINQITNFADNAVSIVIQNDQKIVVGICAGSGGASNVVLARLNSDGTLDATYGTAGISASVQSNGVRTNLSKIAIQGDQKIVAVGFNDDGSNVNVVLARFNMDGTLDSTFIDSNTSAPAGTVNTIFDGGTVQLGRAVSIQDDQNIVAAADRSGLSNEILVARYFVGPYAIITSPTIGQTLTSAQPTITGRMQIGDTIVEVSIDGGAFVSATTVNSGAGTWSFVPSSPLSQGSHIVQARTTDANNVTSFSPVIPFSIDSLTFVDITAPTVNQAINNAQPTILGTMETGNTIVQVSIDSGTLQNAIVNSGAGSWSFISGTLAEGSHTVQAFTQDPLGNTAQTFIVPFTVDTTTFVTITSPTPNEVIKNSVPTFAGTMEVGNTIVQVSINGDTFVDATTVNSNAGSWSFTPDLPLFRGDYTIEARTTDPQGNTAQTVAIPFTISSTTGLTFVTINSPTIDEAVNNERPLISGSMQIGNQIVQVSIDGGALQNAIVDSDAGTWNFTPNSNLSLGSHTVQAFTTNPSGDTAQTIVIPFTVVSNTFVTITSPINGSTITTNRPLLTGITASGNTVEIIIDGVSAGFAIVDSAGHWIFQVTSPLINGVHSIEIIATTPTGDVASVTISITVAATVCIFPADILTQALRNKYGL